MGDDMRAFRLLAPVLAISLGLSAPPGIALAQEAAPGAVEPADAAPAKPPSPRSLRDAARQAPDEAAARAALDQLEALADSDPEAAYILGQLYDAGVPALPPDPARAVPFLETAAAAGDARAYKRLGDLYRATEGLKNPLEAYRNYRQAADLGDAASAQRTGDYLRAGQVVPRDPRAAIAYYEIAAKAGSAASALRLGDLYRTGAADGLDPARALPWYEQAAEAGNAQAYYRLGEFHRTGAGGAPRPDLALQNYQLGAGAGNANALMRMARGLLDSSLAPGRAEDGFALLASAADKGITGARLALGRAQLDGTGTAKDVAAGLATLNAALEEGDVAAGRYLIQLHTGGRAGVSRDLTAARAALDRLRALAAPEVARYEAVILAAAEPGGAARFAAMGEDFDSLDADTRQRLLGRVYALDRNAYVYLVQRRLAALDLYAGPLNGLLTSSTIGAVNALCRARDIAEACRMGPLSGPARRGIAEVIFR